MTHHIGYQQRMMAILYSSMAKFLVLFVFVLIAEFFVYRKFGFRTFKKFAIVINLAPFLFFFSIGTQSYQGAGLYVAMLFLYGVELFNMSINMHFKRRYDKEYEQYLNAKIDAMPTPSDDELKKFRGPQHLSNRFNLNTPISKYEREELMSLWRTKQRKRLYDAFEWYKLFHKKPTGKGRRF